MSDNKTEYYLIRVPTNVDIKSLDGLRVNLKKSTSVNIKEADHNLKYELNVHQKNQLPNMTLLKRIGERDVVVDGDSTIAGYLTLTQKINPENNTPIGYLPKRKLIESADKIIKARRKALKRLRKEEIKKGYLT